MFRLVLMKMTQVSWFGSTTRVTRLGIYGFHKHAILRDILYWRNGIFHTKYIWRMEAQTSQNLRYEDRQYHGDVRGKKKWPKYKPISMSSHWEILM